MTVYHFTSNSTRWICLKRNASARRKNKVPPLQLPYMYTSQGAGIIYHEQDILLCTNKVMEQFMACINIPYLHITSPCLPSDESEKGRHSLFFKNFGKLGCQIAYKYMYSVHKSRIYSGWILMYRYMYILYSKQ